MHCSMLETPRCGRCVLRRARTLRSPLKCPLSLSQAPLRLQPSPPSVAQPQPSDFCSQTQGPSRCANCRPQNSSDTVNPDNAPPHLRRNRQQNYPPETFRIPFPSAIKISKQHSGPKNGLSLDGWAKSRIYTLHVRTNIQKMRGDKGWKRDRLPHCAYLTCNSPTFPGFPLSFLYIFACTST